MLYIQKKKNRLRTAKKLTGRIPIVISIISILTFLYDFGFEHSYGVLQVSFSVYKVAIIVGAFSLVVRYFFTDYRPRQKSIPIDLLLLAFYILVIAKHFTQVSEDSLRIIGHRIWVYAAIFAIFFREFTALRFELKRASVYPAQLFVLSFLIIVIVGSFLLLLPRATVSGISAIDALFTSTSAVCVTGLAVVDTGTHFTLFGQVIIALLIQVGGLGIMTFASYFSYFFKGGSSYESQLVLQDITNSEKISEVFSVLRKIIFVTFLIEGIGALLIFYTLDNEIIPAFSDKVFFSAFHALSGFCNAGFSTLSNSLYESTFRFNYPLHLIISFLIIMGGIGFPIVFNLYKIVKLKVKGYFRYILFKERRLVIPRLVNINTRIVVITSIILTVCGTLAFYLLEYNNTLAPHGIFGKVVTAFFGSVTTRTAGFNTVDTGALNIHTILIVMFLMWVGASPVSTGGGIKTSTLALALMNTVRIVKGKSRLEMFNREIPKESIDRAFAIIVLSIIVICMSILLVSFFDSDKGMLNISFECVSAYSTVGLSRGITASLSIASKIVLIITMFVGRVGMLTFLVAIYKRVTAEAYRLPTENIIIN